MSFIKIITLVGLICKQISIYYPMQRRLELKRHSSSVMGIIIDLGGNPKGDRIGFRNWTDGKAWARYKYDGSLGIFVGFWSVMVK